MQLTLRYGRMRTPGWNRASNHIHVVEVREMAEANGTPSTVTAATVRYTSRTLVKINGVDVTVGELARSHDLRLNDVVKRLNRGKSVSDALAPIVRRQNAKKTERHGLRNSPEYESWRGMVNRCTNPRAAGWELYGGRGITVCEEWRQSFVAFLDHVGRRPSEFHSIDRIDTNRGY